MLLTCLLIFMTVVAGSCGDVLCAKGMASGGEIEGFTLWGWRHIFHTIITRRLVILGALCDAVSFFSLLALLSVAQLSIAVPATALSFVVDTFAARFILHEGVHWKRWAGVLCVAAGVILTVNSGSGKSLRGATVSPTSSVQTHQH